MTPLVNSLTFRSQIQNEDSQTLLLHIALTKCAYLLLASFGVLRRPYIVGKAYKREPELAASPQSSALHSTVNTSVPQQHTWNSKPLLFFPLKYCCLHSLHFQHLMWTRGYRFKTSTVKRSLVSIVVGFLSGIFSPDRDDF